MTQCLVYRKDKFTEGLILKTPWTVSFFVQATLFFILILSFLFLAAFVSRKISGLIFDPLRIFNGKLNNIKIEGMKKDLIVQMQSSIEITDLYDVFRKFIRTKKFENNDFEQKEDALAIIDLAEACDMFKEERPINYKASGICYNNIGNYQYKNGNFN